MNKTLLRTAAVCGLLAGMTCFAYLLGLHAGGLNPFGRYKYLYMAIYAVFFIAGMKYFRDRNQGYMSGQQALAIGLVLNFVASLVYATNIYVFLSYTDAGKTALQRYVDESLRLMEEAREYITENLSEANYNTTYENIQRMVPPEVALDQFIGMSMLGVFLTFVFLLLFKRSRPAPPAPPLAGKSPAKKK